MENKFNKYYYGNTSKCEKNKIDKFIASHKNEKLWSLALFYDNNRRIKYQRKKLFWEGHRNDFATCKTSDLTKYDGLYTFEEAFNLFKEFPLQNTELIRLNYDMKHYDGCDGCDCCNHFILVRDGEAQ